MAPKQQISDRELTELVMERGDEGAFRELYQRHTPHLYQFALRTLGGNEHDADDVVQEMWIRAIEKLGQFRWESDIRGWLSGIALNLCRGLFRRRDRNWLEVREEMIVSESSDDRSDMIDLERAIRLLPEGYRTVFVLHDVEGYRHDEIAHMLGTSTGTSKSQLFHARRAIRRVLSGHVEPQVRTDKNAE